MHIHHEFNGVRCHFGADFSAQGGAAITGAVVRFTEGFRRAGLCGQLKCGINGALPKGVRPRRER